MVADIAGVVLVVLVLTLAVIRVRRRRPRDRSRTAVTMDSIAAHRAETDVRTGHVGGGWTTGGGL